MIKIDDERRAQIKHACRRWRLDNRYKLQDVADLAGTSRQAVLEFERGSGMSRDMLQAYIDLGMPIDLIADVWCSVCGRFPVDVSSHIANCELTKYFSRCPHSGAHMDREG